MAKTFSFSKHSRFVNQFKGKQTRSQEAGKFEIKTNFRKNTKKHKNLIMQQEKILKELYKKGI